MVFNYFSENVVSWLKTNIPQHLEHYQGNELDEHVHEEALKMGGIMSADLPIVLPKLDTGTGTPGHDADNVRIVYSQMKNLTCTQAADERLWSYMTHIQSWDYMQKRWGASSTSAKDKNNFVAERYFLKTNNSRWLIRNGISRLWWFGHLTYTDVDQWQLTNTLLELQDVQASLLERSYGRNKKILHATLRVIAEHREALEESLQTRFGGLKKGYQQLGIYVGLIGGTGLLDTMPDIQIEKEIKKKFL